MHDRTRLGRIVWSGTAVVALCFVAIMVVTAWENHERTLREASRNAQNNAALLSEQLRGLLSSTEILLGLIEKRGLSERHALGSRSVNVSGTLDEVSDFVGGGIFTRRGLIKPVVAASAMPDIPHDIVMDLMAGVASHGRIWITRPFGEGDDLYVLLGRSPRSLAAASKDIAVAVVMPLRRLTKLVTEPDVGESGVVSLLRTDGIMLARAPYMEDLLGRSFSHFVLFDEIERQGASGRFRLHFKSDDVFRLAAYKAVQDAPLVVAVASGYHEALASWRRDMVRDGLILAIILCVLLVAATLLAPLLAAARRGGKPSAREVGDPGDDPREHGGGADPDRREHADPALQPAGARASRPARGAARELPARRRADGVPGRPQRISRTCSPTSGRGSRGR